jgi:hypothetical protein
VILLDHEREVRNMSVHAYYVFNETFHKGKCIRESICGYLLTTTPQVDKSIELTWENLDEWYTKHGLSIGGNLWKTKKGRKFCFFDSNTTIKEWKEPLNLTVKTFYREWKPTIQNILDYHNIDLAIQYLNEHGLKIGEE